MRSCFLRVSLGCADLSSRRVYPRISLRLRAPVEVQNLLPHDVRYRVFDKNLEHNWTSFLRQGGVSPIHVAELSHLLLLSVEVQDTGKRPCPKKLEHLLISRPLPVFQRSEFAIINTDNPEDLPVENDLVLQDKEGLKLNLRVHYQCVCITLPAQSNSTDPASPRRKHPDSGGAFRVQVYSPYIFINKTGNDFALKTKTFMSSAKNVAGQEVFAGASGSSSSDEAVLTRDPRSRSQAQGARALHVLVPDRGHEESRPSSHQRLGVVEGAFPVRFLTSQR